jgi:hypothetical protein
MLRKCDVECFNEDLFPEFVAFVLWLVESRLLAVFRLCWTHDTGVLYR